MSAEARAERRRDPMGVRSGDSEWESMAPPAVARLIRRHGYLGFRA